MQSPVSALRRWLLLPVVLVCIHSTLVAVIAVSVATSTDSEAVMAWFLPYYIDYPASLLVHIFDLTADWQTPVFFLILGVLYWGIIGTMIQSVWRWLTRRHEKVPG
jgi:hypothetical protein